MRWVASALSVAVLASAAGCGGSADPKGRRALDAFFSRTSLGRTLGKRFPHDPGSVPCAVFDRKLQKRVEATCATDVSVDPTRIVVTFTESWSHGSRTHTWFVFLRRDGTVKSVRQEGAAATG
ncbi:MAG TPA: hypothetical protein VNH40_10875 [Gaiellaceae bacterium]|nr:hypothetical protein [Gaiellaceae bacterium]